MIRDLSHQRCFNHQDREAVARCPQCSRFFCRECVTEHEERVLCLVCLRKLALVPLLQRRGFAGMVRLGKLLCGIFIAWFFFYLIGELLISIPASFHKSTVWHQDWFDSD